MIELDDITIGYGRDILLRGASCRIEAGKATALLGRNGAGKSTLLRVMSGMAKPIAGTVSVDGRDIAAMRPRELSRTVSLVTTERVRMPNLYCRDVVALGRAPYTNWVGRMSDRDYEIVEQSLALVGMSAYARRTMDTMSDGECQRIMIARALAQDTQVIMLDEPTSFLDLPNRYELVSLLATTARERGKCVLFSTHELDIALMLCDTVMLIDNPSLLCLPTSEMLACDRLAQVFDTRGFDMRGYLRSFAARQGRG